jgi:FkbM family methyltransferase
LKGKLQTIFDVGSNIGEWTTMAREIHPDANIHTFEVVPEVYRKFLNNVTLDQKITPNGFGLSNECGVLPMKWRKDHDVVSSFIPNLAVENAEWRDGLVFTGDMYRKSRSVEYIDFLKIDTEGAEGMVLKGFKQSLEEQRIGIIQFEYGFAAILTKWLLVDAYEMLNPLGFALGRLTPEGIEFHQYQLFHETFNGPDYVAVHESKLHLFDKAFVR